MKKKKDDRTGSKAPQRKSGSTLRARGGAVRARVSEVRVRHLDAPPTIIRPKSIHPRRQLPFVAEGQERAVHSLDTRAFIHQREDAGLDVQILLDTPLTQPAQKRTASNVGEPSLSMNGDVVFYTGHS